MNDLLSGACRPNCLLWSISTLNSLSSAFRSVTFSSWLKMKTLKKNRRRGIHIRSARECSWQPFKNTPICFFWRWSHQACSWCLFPKQTWIRYFGYLKKNDLTLLTQYDGRKQNAVFWAKIKSCFQHKKEANILMMGRYQGPGKSETLEAFRVPWR